MARMKARASSKPWPSVSDRRSEGVLRDSGPPVDLWQDEARTRVNRAFSVNWSHGRSINQDLNGDHLEKVSRVLLGTQVIATGTGRSRENCEGEQFGAFGLQVERLKA
jgi:hypothetical protein